MKKEMHKKLHKIHSHCTENHYESHHNQHKNQAHLSKELIAKGIAGKEGKAAEKIKDEKLSVTLNIERYDPDGAEQNSKFILEVTDKTSVLEALEMIKENVDGSLTFSRGCKSGKCGACGVMVNGQPKLACETRIKEIIERYGSNNISISPMRNFNVLKDLVVDMSDFFMKIEKVSPFLISDIKNKDIKIPDRDMLKELKSAIDCIMCGLCGSSCDVVRHNDSFIGPAAMIKAYRFVNDYRDMKQKERLKNLVKNGLWSCAHEQSCNYVCPRGIDPAYAIADLRNISLDHGIYGDRGVRAVKYYLDTIRYAGKPYGSHISVHGRALPKHRKAFAFDDLKIIYREIERERVKFDTGNLRDKKVPGHISNNISK